MIYQEKVHKKCNSGLMLETCVFTWKRFKKVLSTVERNYINLLSKNIYFFT